MREQNVIDFYLICYRLKDTIRSGWKDWKVKKERLESVAEHIYSTQMLAIAVNSEFKYNLDMYKVIYLIAIHELGETIIGDVTPFAMDRA